MNVIRFFTQSAVAAFSSRSPGSRDSRTQGRAQGAAHAAPTGHTAGPEPSRAGVTGGMVYGSNARRGPASALSQGNGANRLASRDGVERAPAPQALPRSGLGAIVRGWMRLLSPSVWAPVHDAPHPLVVRVVRWAPIVAPAVIGGALLACALGLVARVGHPAFAPLPEAFVVPTLIGAYLVGGALLGVALYFAPNGVVWSLALCAIPAALLVVMLGLAFGAPGALLAVAVIAALPLLYSAARHTRTRPGVVEVTLFLGEWYRTLPPGYNILLPGERTLVALGTVPRTFTTPFQRVAISPGRVAQARATVSYAVNPSEAWRTAGVRATWEDELRQRVIASVRESIHDWRYMPDGQLVAHGSIAQRTLDDTRDWARSIGVRLLSVRAHDIVVGSLDELPLQPGGVRAYAAPRFVSSPPVQSAPPARPMASADPHAFSYDDPPDDPDDPNDPNEPPDDPDGPDDTLAAPSIARIPGMAPRVRPSVERPSPEALEDLYEAVRNRQITDTQVIREIASHFAGLGREPSLRAALPFDPVAAASLLDDYAEALDTARPAQRVRRR
ncbi:MAG TPA: hypothetical protein VFN78_01200 [Ktedonobacterales bacterium]|nr:hypothetical protein [Ktedonobacterales bacterium]